MKFQVYILLIVFVTIRATTDQELWVKLKAYFRKQYKSSDQERDRFSIFQKNLIKIKQHNGRYLEGKETYFLNWNKFFDLTGEEFLEQIRSIRLSPVHTEFLSQETITEQTNITEQELPTDIDWRNKGVVNEVQDQGLCGAGWAFSVTGSLEGQYALNTSKLLPLSEQQLIDCSEFFIDTETGGGNMEKAFQYVENNGLATKAKYPASCYNEQCLDGTVTPTVHISGYKLINQSESSLQNAVATVGPISAAVAVNTNWQFYSGGIFSSDCPEDGLNLAVLVVGYSSGSSNTTSDDYWIIRNSWGKYWGELGYIRLLKGLNLCGIADYTLYPIL